MTILPNLNARFRQAPWDLLAALTAVATCGAAAAEGPRRKFAAAPASTYARTGRGLIRVNAILRYVTVAPRD